MSLSLDAKGVMLNALKDVAVRVIALDGTNATVSVAPVAVSFFLSQNKLEIGSNLEIEITAGETVTQVRITNLDGTVIYGTQSIGASESFPYGGKLILTVLDIELT